MNSPNKAVFLDRDGVLNEEIGTYICELSQFVVSAGVPAALARLKAAGYYLVVVTNQAGIAKNLYDHAHVAACHQVLQEASGHLLDAIYYAPSHPSVSESIFRKPDSGMLEKAIARFHLDPAQCWIVGDRLRDMQAGAKVGVRGILVGHEETAEFSPRAADLQAAADIILGAS